MPDDIVSSAEELRRFSLYSLSIIPLWEGEAEHIDLGTNLEAIIAQIVGEKSVAGFVGREIRPMRFCRIEQEEALYLPQTRQTFYARERQPVWKVMVPASGIYSRETILSCLDRGGGRNIEKYASVLFLHPRADAFYTFSTNEIRPVDESVFVLEHPVPLTP